MIELLIGVTLSLILLAGIIVIYTNNKRSFLISENLSDMQRNAQFTQLLLNRTIRHAGFRSSPDFTTLKNYDDFDAIYPPGSEIVSGSDNSVGGNDNLTVRFQGNSDSEIYDCLAQPVLSNQLAINTFSINNSNELICSAINNGVANPNNPEVMVENIQGMQIRYGQDANGDGIVDRFVPANYPGLNFNNVKAVRISILMRSRDQINPVLDNKTYTMQDVSYGPFNDRFLRRVYTSTIQLRSMPNDAQ